MTQGQCLCVTDLWTDCTEFNNLSLTDCLAALVLLHTSYSGTIYHSDLLSC